MVRNSTCFSPIAKNTVIAPSTKNDTKVFRISNEANLICSGFSIVTPVILVLFFLYSSIEPIFMFHAALRKLYFQKDTILFK